MTHIIITVPHGKCRDNTLVRQCDERANEAADALAALLPSAAVYRAPTYRSEGDLNRPTTRNTEWRRAIQTDVADAHARGQRVVLFDIHSFPNSSKSFGVLPLENLVPQLVLLDNDASFPHANLARLIGSATSVRLVLAHVGADSNDIVSQAHAAGADAMLWEFNEDATWLSHEQIVQVARVLADYAAKSGTRHATH
jgi:hypothetical protein